MRNITIERDGKIYHTAKFYLDKYALLDQDLRVARANGLPFIMVKATRYYNETDLHDYYSGRIGNDVNRKQKSRKPIDKSLNV